MARHGRRLKRLGNLKAMNDTLPFDFGLLKIDWQTEGHAGGSHIVETLRGVFGGEPFHTFQLDHQYVFDENIGKVFSNRVAFVCHCKRSLGSGPDATEAEFSKQGTLVDFLEESGAESVGDLKDSAKHTLG
jgi:hypothetical protein